METLRSMKTMKIYKFLVSAFAASALLTNAANAGGRKLVPSDVVQIHVVNQPDLDAQPRIEADGTITFPYAGRIRAAGLTEDQLAARIKSALADADVVKSPQVIISTTTFGTQVSVAGSVKAPTQFSVDRPTTLTEALTKGGGLAEGARRVVVRHKVGKGVVVNSFDAKSLLSSSRNVYIENGDEIFVEEAPSYYLYGYVGKPGRYSLSQSVSVQQALAVGGGITDMGSDWRIEVKRRRKDGELIQRSVTLDETVLPNDTIIVNERIF